MFIQWDTYTVVTLNEFELHFLKYLNLTNIMLSVKKQVTYLYNIVLFI